MADTHGVLRPEVEKIVETCDAIVHAGDFDTQMLYMKLSGSSHFMQYVGTMTEAGLEGFRGSSALRLAA